MNRTSDDKRLAAVKQAEVLSVLGAGVLGAGLALLAPAALGPYVYALIGVGIVVHGLGMSAKHRLERQVRELPRWERWLFILCWAVLAVLAWAVMFGARLA